MPFIAGDCYKRASVTFATSSYHLHNYMRTLFWYFLPKIPKNKDNNLKNAHVTRGTYILGETKAKERLCKPRFYPKHLCNAYETSSFSHANGLLPTPSSSTTMASLCSPDWPEHVIFLQSPDRHAPPCLAQKSIFKQMFCLFQDRILLCSPGTHL